MQQQQMSFVHYFINTTLMMCAELDNLDWLPDLMG